MSEAKTPDQGVQRWLNHIAAYDREFKRWTGRVEKILKKYRDERSATGNTSARFNILWANVQTLVPATFSRLPRPDVSRRFRDNDPVGRVAALIVERALDYEIQHYSDYRHALSQAIEDRFLGGRGTAWVRYEPHIKRVEGPDKEPGGDAPGTESAQGDQLPEAGLQITEDSSATSEELDYECTPVDYVHWKDFGHTVARTWEEVTAVWRVVYMTREMNIERFGEALGKTIPLDAKPEELTKNQLASEAEFSRAKIYEIWDISTKTVIWLSKSMEKVLDVRQDPLGLDEFWPCPRPLFATLTNDSLVPVPDFTIYQDQQATLDVLANRIDLLVRALKVTGVYNAAEGVALARLFTEAEDNELKPIKEWAAFSEKNGLKGAIDVVDLAPMAAALKEAYAAMDNVKAQVYELTGISDIIRGQSEELETATAIKTKGQYASLRLKSYQDDVAHFATGLLQIKAQIICGKYDDQTLMAIAAVQQLSPEDQQIVPQALQLLRSNLLRNFRVDIEADTLVQLDEEAEKEARVEFLKATGDFMQSAMPMVEAAAQQGAIPLVGLIFELLKFGVTGYKVGKTIEGKFDQALEQLQQLLAQPKPPQANPEVMKIQAEQAAQEARMQADVQIEQAKLEFERQRMAMQAQTDQMEAQRNAELEQFKAHLEAQQQASQLAFDQWKAKLENETKIAVAELQAKTQIKTAGISANAGADPLNAGEVGEDGEAKPAQSLADLIGVVNDSMQQLIKGNEALVQGHAALTEQLGRPKTVTLPDGRKASLQ